MTKFEEIGIDRMLRCIRSEDMERCYNRSCQLCCQRGRNVPCKTCAIDVAYNALKKLIEQGD